MLPLELINSTPLRTAVFPRSIALLVARLYVLHEIENEPSMSMDTFKP